MVTVALLPGIESKMPPVEANGIQIEYECFGEPNGRPLLLIMGLGSQLTRWHHEFCSALAAEGHYVIRYDNRDVGLSTHLDDAGVPDMMKVTAGLLSGEAVEVPYGLDEMAADALALMDALNLPQAHLCGASLGGMIAQTVAIQAPERVLSLTSIMSSTGNRSLPPATPEAMAALMSPPASDREAAAERTLAISKIIGSPGYPADPDEVRARAQADFDRANNGAGVARQMAAAASQPDRRQALGTLSVRALVIHGTDDPLVPKEGGIDTHQALKDSELLLIEGMGHDLPRALWPRIVEAISRLTRN